MHANEIVNILQDDDRFIWLRFVSYTLISFSLRCDQICVLSSIRTDFYLQLSPTYLFISDDLTSAF